MLDPILCLVAASLGSTTYDFTQYDHVADCILSDFKKFDFPSAFKGACGAGHRCSGPSCIGSNDDSVVSGNDTGTFCVKRFQPKTVAVNDIYQSASEIQTLVTNNKDKPMVEVALGRSNFVIRKQTIVGSHSDIEVPYDVTITNDVSVSTTPFISLEPINRLRMPEDPRCHEEYCIPLPCTFLDMNYAGEPLFSIERTCDGQAEQRQPYFCHRKNVRRA